MSAVLGSKSLLLRGGRALWFKFGPLALLSLPVVNFGFGSPVCTQKIDSK